MQTIVQPNGNIKKLWGSLKYRNGESFRLMDYTLRVDYNNKTLLHNVVTGHLVVLNDDEQSALGKETIECSDELRQLIQDHFLVPVKYNEYQTVIRIRYILNRVFDNQNGQEITNYTIFPTTACNARCYYCFEKDIKKTTMSSKMTKHVVDYISSHCGSKKKVYILWFGGEPTVASDRIDDICKGLQVNGIRYRSTMITNGYLLDEEMINKARNLWNLDNVQISVDGTEQTYNSIKSFVKTHESSYRRVLKNIGLLLANEIYVNLRMNYDLNNYLEFDSLLEEVNEYFGINKYLHVYAYPIIGRHTDNNGQIKHGSEEWFKKKTLALNNRAREIGLWKNKGVLPSLNYVGCGAARANSVTITAEGFLVRCPEQLGVDQITGDVEKGVFNAERVSSWKERANYIKCKRCILFPSCVRIAKCEAKDSCLMYEETINQYKEAMKLHFLQKNEEVKSKNGV